MFVIPNGTHLALLKQLYSLFLCHNPFSQYAHKVTKNERNAKGNLPIPVLFLGVKCPDQILLPFLKYFLALADCLAEVLLVVVAVWGG